MSIAETQLTLRLAPQEIYQLTNFLFATHELQKALTEFVEQETLKFVYLAGESGSGKSHLLFACADALQKAGQRVIYLSLAELKSTASPEILHDLEHVDLLCLDDLDAISGEQQWEEAIFHCYNRLQQSQGKLLVAANTVPSQLELSLPDLKSRLATGLVYQLVTMQDEQKQQALILQAQARGLTMSDEVAQFLLRRYGRDMPSLMQVLIQLDKASLQAQRRLTIPFVKQVLSGG